MSQVNKRPWGPIPKEKVEEIVNAPFGEAKKIINQYDPLWGQSSGNPLKKKYEVRVTMNHVIRKEATIIVDAASKALAEEAVRKLGGDEFEWDEFDEDEEDFEIEGTEEVEDDASK